MQFIATTMPFIYMNVFYFRIRILKTFIDRPERPASEVLKEMKKTILKFFSFYFILVSAILALKVLLQLARENKTA